MDNFRFKTQLEVRYSDLDAQGHLNHARYFSFMEQARFKYIMALGLWQSGQDFQSVGQIVAEATCTYKQPVQLDEVVDVWVRVSQIGNKSMIMDYRLTVGDAEAEVATGRTVQVAYDYAAGKSIPIPAAWRASIEAFEAGRSEA